MMKDWKKTGIIAAAVLLVLLILGGSCLYTVRDDQYAVVTQFGRIVRVEDEPGLKAKIPFIQSYKYVPKAVQLYDLPSSDVITKDKKSMIANTYILWRVDDPVKFTQTLSASIIQAQDRCDVAAYNALKNVISSMTQEEIIAARGERLTSLITDEANRNMQEYGIELIMNEIKSLDLPEDNKEAVYERMISERRNIAASYEAEGKANAQKIRNETDKRIAVMQAQAEQNAQILEAEGEAEYMRILSEAYASPDKESFYSYVRGLDALKQSMKGGNKMIILDSESELAKILYGSY